MHTVRLDAILCEQIQKVEAVNRTEAQEFENTRDRWFALNLDKPRRRYIHLLVVLMLREDAACILNFTYTEAQLRTHIFQVRSCGHLGRSRELVASSLHRAGIIRDLLSIDIHALNAKWFCLLICHTVR